MHYSHVRQYSSDKFINRELSLLQFQRRVLAQAADPAVPLLERLVETGVALSEMPIGWEPSKWGR